MKQKIPESRLNEIEMAVSQASSLVKTTIGVVNNAAWMACIDAFDHIRRHPAYRHKAKATYKRCFAALKAYERQLVYGGPLRFFHLDDLAPEARKAFGDITDRDYYDFWAAFGYTAYADNRPFYTCLVNKLRLAYQNHGEPYPDILAWSTAAGLCLDMAGEIYRSTLRVCVESKEWRHASIPRKVWEYVFAQFDISHVAHLWEEANKLLSGKENFALTPTEKSNIDIGYQQLMEKWMDEDTLFGSRIKTSEDYAEVFRTKGELKKAQRQFDQLRNNAKQFALTEKQTV